MLNAYPSVETNLYYLADREIRTVFVQRAQKKRNEEMTNQDMIATRRNPKDEFYTQITDIEKDLNLAAFQRQHKINHGGTAEV